VDGVRGPIPYRPDAWIKLCGMSDGCTIHGLPNPWEGKDVYNTTGHDQTISVRMEEGEGVRFWMVFQNDAEQDDSIVVQGCTGDRNFKVNNVQVGFYKRPTAGSVQITDDFKHGTASFDLTPASHGDEIKITLNIIAKTRTQGVSYTCPVTITSQNDTSVTDTVVAKMVTI
jgi:hypothetical protein